MALHYEAYGVGKPLLLLHGFGGAPNWHPFTAHLAARYRLLVVELPGHGHSPHLAHPFTHRQAAQAVFRLLDQLGVPHFAAMGMSSGAMTPLAHGHESTSAPRRVGLN